MKHRTLTRNPLARAAVVAAAIAGTAAVMPAAAAAPGEWQTSHSEFVEVNEDFCDVPGLTVRDEGSGDSRDRDVIRGGLPYFEGHSVDTDVYTNLANGEFVTVVEQRNDRSVHVTDNGDGTLTVRYLASGVNVMYDQAGNILDRGAGSVSVDATFDNGGTPSDPSDDEPFAFDLLRESGPSIDLCTNLIRTIA